MHFTITLPRGRICVSCAFYKQVNWATSPGQPLEIEPFCPLCFFRKVMASVSILPVTSPLNMNNPGQTTAPCQGRELHLKYPALNSYPGSLRSRGTHQSNPPRNTPRGKTSSTAAALKLQEGDPEMKADDSYGNPALFKHTQLSF